MIDLTQYTARKKRWLKDQQMVCVYTIGPARNGPTKIGYAADFVSRFNTLQGGNWTRIFPFTALWCAGLPVAKRIEEIAHQRLNHKHIMGEWFDISADDAAEIVRGTAAEFYPTMKFRDHDALILLLEKKYVEKYYEQPRGQSVANRLENQEPR